MKLVQVVLLKKLACLIRFLVQVPFLYNFKL